MDEAYSDGQGGEDVPQALTAPEDPSGHQPRPDDGRKGDTAPADPCEKLLEEVECMVAPGLRALKNVIAKAVGLSFPPGDMAYLLEGMSKITKKSIALLNQLHRDHLNTAGELGVLHTPERVSMALLNTLERDYLGSVWARGTLWVYADGDTAESGYFSRYNREKLEGYLLQELGYLPCLATAGARREVIARVASALRADDYFDDAPSGLNVGNGLVSFDPARSDVVLLPPGPEHKARWRLPVVYDPEAQAPVLQAGLERTFPDSASLESFQEFVGCALLEATPGRDNARHALLLVGPQNSGKSTILNVLKLMVPDYAVSAVPPTKWGREYDRAMLEGKCLNLLGELGESTLIPGDDFKAIVGRDAVTARLPHIAPFKFLPRAWHFFATNTVPKTDDRDPAFERRILAFRLERTLRQDEVIPDFLRRVSEELPGVLAWAVEGALRAMRRGYFQCPPAHREIVAEMQHGGDLIARFAISQVEKAPETEPGLPNHVLHGALKLFAQRENIGTEDWQPSTGMRRLAGVLRAMYGATRYQVNGIPHYRGVRLRNVS